MYVYKAKSGLYGIKSICFNIAITPHYLIFTFKYSSGLLVAPSEGECRDSRLDPVYNYSV